ncbi:P450-derived glycosyltransferase activator [Micromonospora fluostatini]|uniref:P450-derived glycosyltransferase activator n=1 Tax=Micromonospora fluostatini TaxID=1629071 RepID=A0ABY2DIE9_9ACTN|nr:P450-derived glycosyltransferase activator [Micromonospora fluostatini]
MTTVPTGGDPATWARRLQLTRAAQWFAGNHGDPYALILRAETDDPTPYEQQVTAHGPLFRSDQLDTWVTGDAALAGEVLTDDRFGWLTRSGHRPAERTLPLAGTALDHGPETRRRLDALTGLGGPVLRTDAEGLRIRVEKSTLALLDGAGTDVDLATVARRLTASVLADLLGVPAGRQGRFEETLAAAGRTLDSRLCPQTVAHALATVAATAELAGLLAEASAAAQGEPGAGPATDVRADDRVTAGLALAVGTAEPATTLLCNAVRALLDRPAQWALLCADPDLAAVAVEETLRWFPPVRLESRVALEDVTLAGQLVPADGHLVVLVAAANRALLAAGDPDRDGFDLTRPAAPALGLVGVPYLAGAGELIRLVVTTTLRTLAEAAPTLRPAGPGVRWRRSPVLLGHARLPVTRAGGTPESDDRPATEEATRCES